MKYKILCDECNELAESLETQGLLAERARVINHCVIERSHGRHTNGRIPRPGFQGSQPERGNQENLGA